MRPKTRTRIAVKYLYVVYLLVVRFRYYDAGLVIKAQKMIWKLQFEIGIQQVYRMFLQMHKESEI